MSCTFSAGPMNPTLSTGSLLCKWHFSRRHQEDFLVELMLQERESSQEATAFDNGFQRHQSLAKEFLASPVIFLRKWMGEDFLCHASRLLTADIQRAWIHLQRGALPADIPGLNQLNPRPLVDLSPRHDSAEAGRNYLGFREISLTGVKDILLKIVLPVPWAETPHAFGAPKEMGFQHFDPSALKLTVSVFCGPEMLRSKTNSLKPPLLRKTREKPAPQRETQLTYNCNGKGAEKEARPFLSCWHERLSVTEIRCWGVCEGEKDGQACDRIGGIIPSKTISCPNKSGVVFPRPAELRFPDSWMAKDRCISTSSC
ncbi:uncharacterized protein LOC128336186 [Hemicordylus capensis]|uniref:uncharacterized protein LOC128336186 n=1 Tax=Hemicordylus capensis TaxID=884348 RepID=UPI002304B4FF|nr:uncharacterized protein LOC128336186 [Hemicordylus capensis]XP_053131404.1 uncharacterized protein LOC128336186 [Hemicordylus capensis]XP_053131405.1 uncharacterized protein LOC128336186 [Hemicordylus capensis]XP_053131406.1 uncharacterized protein LOC128336186 [Hemicordylus capensis]XP_053131408.1 uncharacterized protein LOC128336186 [Hemicordylus capensis]XP_053131409.1 uncharacterized protein LOC128336186 [Hemicordylus capensis]XP_053131410.1 uncharacterized protein LOC128336186 [Hemico